MNVKLIVPAVVRERRPEPSDNSTEYPDSVRAEYQATGRQIADLEERLRELEGRRVQLVTELAFRRTEV